MGEFKIISNTDDELEIEITQPNDLIGDQSFWTEEDHKKWNDKMARLDAEGIRGQEETIVVKLKKNPFINGKVYTGGQDVERDADRKSNDTSNDAFQRSNEIIENKSETGYTIYDVREIIERFGDETQGPTIQPE